MVIDMPISGDSGLQEDVRRLLLEEFSSYSVNVEKVSVKHVDDVGGEFIYIAVKKSINGVPETFKQRIAVPDVHDAAAMQNLNQQIELVAQNIVTTIEEMVTETISVCGTDLLFCAEQDGWAECRMCDERVTTDELTNSFTPVTAESSMPSPEPYVVQEYAERLNSFQQEVLKLYLFGVLRQKKCVCDFGKRDHAF